MRFAPLSFHPPARLPRAAPLAASAVAHAILLLAVARWYQPPQPQATRATPPRQEVVWIDFPASDAAALPGPAGIAEAGQAPRSPRAVRPSSPAARTPAGETAAPAPPAVEGIAGSSAPAAAPSRPWSPDPRLYVDTRRLPPAPERPDHARLATDFAAALRADSVRAAEAARQSLARRQVTAFGRRVTVGGDSAAAGFRTEAIEARRDVLTMPGDRIMWERLQVSIQDGQQARDSVFRERVRATRARKDADRRP